MSIYSYFKIDTSIKNALNGISVLNVAPGLNIGLILYLLLKPMVAFIVNEMIMRLVAFWGMLLLLENHIFLEEGDCQLISVGISLCFSMLRFWPCGFLAIAGQPFVLYAFLNILKNQRPNMSWIIIIVFTMYSSLIFAGFSVCVMFCIILLFDVVSNKRVNYPGVLALSTIILLYLISNYKLIQVTFFESSFVSHRVEMRNLSSNIRTLFLNSLKELYQVFIFGKTGFTDSFHSLVIMPSTALGIFFLVKNKENSLIYKLTLSITITSFFFAFWSVIKYYLPSGLLITGFNWSRIKSLNPLLWYLTFGLSLSIIGKNIKKAHYLIAILLLVQLCFNIYHSDPYQEYKKRNLTFKEFYSESLFTDIDNYIGKPLESYRVVSIGMYPSIALFNGFYTLDVYANYYPLTYKHMFRKIIKKELEKNEDLRKYFDYLGNRCYVFVDELAKYTLCRIININKNSGIKIKNLELNTKVLKEMGGEYIFSSVEIVNYKENNLKFLTRIIHKIGRASCN